MGKGTETRQAILREALNLTSEVGLEGLSIGGLAARAGMSKSGLYAHFESKEGLQRQILDAAADRFIDLVVAPALKADRGLPRIEALFERWLEWEHSQWSGGCPFLAAAAEFEDRPGSVRDQLTGHLRDMLGTIARAARIAVEEGHFRTDLDADQFAYQFWAALLAYQQYLHLLDDPQAGKRVRIAFEELVQGATA